MTINLFRNLWFLVLTGLIFTIFFSCNDEEKKITSKDLSKLKEPLIRVNKYLVEKDDEIIGNYIKRRNWKMTRTQTGLWFMVYQQGKGKIIKPGNKVSIAFQVHLLDGTLCYSSDSTGLKHFIVGKAQVEAGLEQGILFLRGGDKAYFIIPPHLAHGLIGDQEKIPARSIIQYDVEVKDVKE